jgi:uncharacterized membrane protein YcaP (DUF421 family)
LLIISETTQSALTDQDNSFTNSILLILTLLGLDVLLSCLKQRFAFFERIMDGVPLLVFTKGECQKTALQMERIDREDILHAARRDQGLATLDQVEYAILEPTGDITIIPKCST